MELTDFNIIETIPPYKTKHRHLIEEFICMCPNCEKEFKIKRIDHKILTEKGNTCKSCKSKKHGYNQNNSRLYRIWNSMKHRTKCKNKKDKTIYEGISVCEEWKKDFIVFRKWALNNNYDHCFQIDRINNNGNYEPSNCRWVKQTIQNQNQRPLKSTNTTGYKGLERRSNGNYSVRVTVEGKRIGLGTYKTAKEGAKAYNDYIVSNNLEHSLNIF